MSDQKKPRSRKPAGASPAGPTEVPDGALDGASGGASGDLTEDSLTSVDGSFARTGQLSSSADPSQGTLGREGVFPLDKPRTRG